MVKKVCYSISLSLGLSYSLHLSLSISSFSFSVHIDLTITADSSRPSKYQLQVPVCISTGNWLTDEAVNAAQALLAKAYPHIGGLQDTAVAKTLVFDIQRGEFV